MPLFPELTPYLEAVRDELLGDPDFDPKRTPMSTLPVITRFRDTKENLRTQLLRIIKRAAVAPWPTLFQNLRASRATELAGEHPGHVAAAWLGHSTTIAQKHYWQLTDADYDRAMEICAAKPLQQLTETGEADGSERKVELRKPLDVRKPA